MATGQAPETAAKASFFEDFIDIFTSPAEVFRRRMGSNPWLVILAITVIFAALFFVAKGILQPAFDGEFARATAKAMAKNPQVTAAMMEQQRPLFEKISMVIVIVVPVLSILLAGLVLWLVGKIFRAQQKAGDAIMVASYAFLPRVLASLATIVIALLTDPANLNGMYRATASVGHFLNPDTASPLAVAIGGRIDLFIIWQTILLGIGLSVTGKITRQQGFIAAAIVWLIGAVPALLQGMQ